MRKPPIDANKSFNARFLSKVKRHPTDLLVYFVKQDILILLVVPERCAYNYRNHFLKLRSMWSKT